MLSVVKHMAKKVLIQGIEKTEGPIKLTWLFRLAGLQGPCGHCDTFS